MSDKTPLFAVLALALFVGLARAGQGETYFVSTDGSDDNPGTEAAPFRTIQHAADEAQPGDTVRVAAGMYQEAVTFPRSGEPEAPIAFEGERGPDGEWLTVLDRSTPATGWEPAPEVGEGVFKAELGFNPGCLTLGGKMLARVHDRHMARERDDLRGGFNLLAMPADEPLHGSERIEGFWIGRNLVEGHGFWDGLRAIYGYRDGVTYIRFRDGDDPRQMELLAAPLGAGFVLRDRGHIVIRHFLVQGAEICVGISGEGAVGNVVEDSRLTHGRMRVELSNGAARNVIRNNEMTLNYYGHESPGAWGTGAPTMETSKAYYVYRTFKNMLGPGSSDDRAVQTSRAGEGNEIVGNRIYGGLIGVSTGTSKGLVVRDNVISGMSSVGIVVQGGALDTHIHDNLIYNCNILIRLHNMNAPNSDGHRAYIFRNRLWNPWGVGNHTHPHIPRQMAEEPPPLEIAFYHNTLAGGRVGFNFNERIPEKPGFRYLNNVVATQTSARTVMALLDNPNRLGACDYNWLGGPQAGARGPVAWFGEHTIIAPGENPWPDDALPDFRLPEGHAARNAGIDLSRPFTVQGKAHDPLPGMEPGYFQGDRPDMGAVQHGGE